MENSVMLNAVCNEPVSLKVLQEPFYRKGFSPFVNKETGTWWEYDDDKKGFFDTGIIAQGRDGNDYVITEKDYNTIVERTLSNVNPTLDDKINVVKDDLDDIQEVIQDQGLVSRKPITSIIGNFTTTANGYLSANPNYDCYLIDVGGCNTINSNIGGIFGYWSEIPKDTSQEGASVTIDGTRHFDQNITVTENCKYITLSIGVGTEPPVITSHDTKLTLKEDVENLKLRTLTLNKLNGLKLVTAGDSITEGLTTTTAEDGNKKTYGWFAKEHYNMNYVNIGMSGRTMADVKVNGVTRNGFAVERYLLVPDDTDVLTIWFGWNDISYGGTSLRDDYCMTTYNQLYVNCTTEQKAEADNHADWTKVFIGETNSTDKKTWCGAWNFVLNYFTVTKPIERFGVIIPYMGIGTNQDLLRGKLIELCKMYGVSYIDANDIKDVPSIGYGLVNMKNSSTLLARYTADSTHPNEDGYKRIARGYIPWIARI